MSENCGVRRECSVKASVSNRVCGLSLLLEGHFRVCMRPSSMKAAIQILLAMWQLAKTTRAGGCSEDNGNPSRTNLEQIRARSASEGDTIPPALAQSHCSVQTASQYDIVRESVYCGDYVFFHIFFRSPMPGGRTFGKNELR